MFISFNKYLKGESLESLLAYKDQFYDYLIADYQKKVEQLKMKSTKKSPIQILLTKPYLLLNENDKLNIYNCYINYSKNIAALSGQKLNKLPTYEQCSDDTIQQFQSFLALVYNIKKENSEIVEYETEIKKLINEKNNVIMINISREDLFSNMEQFKRLCMHFSVLKNKKLVIGISHNMLQKNNNAQADYLFTTDELTKLTELNSFLKSAGMDQNIRFNELKEISDEYDFKNSWDLENVIKANKCVDTIVEKIKSQKLSPYETMVYIHKFITKNYQYTFGGVQKDNNIMGVFTDGSIICSGYSSLTKAIIDKLNMPGLSADFIGCHLYGKEKLLADKKGSHSQCLIHITDPKYNIKGTYVNDACWDSKTKDFPNGKGFAHFLYPVSDVQHFNNTIYVQHFAQNRYENLIIDIGQLNEQQKNNKSFLSKLKFNAKIKSKKYKPELVEKYEKNSKPIPLLTLKSALYAIAAKTRLAQNQADMDLWVNEQINNSIIAARFTFDDTASNAILQEALSRNIKSKKSKNLLKDNDNGAIK
ncbi:MAG: hypothetical protein E7376_05270 [Clostridiales bacterium]|nr:hypothetical protein [Clostridiales bacterium]